MAQEVDIHTNLGDIVVALDSTAPNTVANFLKYVTANRYDNTFIHRVTTLANTGLAVVQGGGYSYANGSVSTVPAYAAVANEYSASRPNAPMTIAMAKLGGNPDSATSQFFFNVSDNSTTLGPSNNGGFTVFGTVVYGWGVVTTASTTPTYNLGSPFDQLPLLGYSGGAVANANLITILDVFIVDLRVTATTDYRAQTVSNVGTILFTAPSASSALFKASQFGGSGVSSTVQITGDIYANQIGVDATAVTSFSAAGFTYEGWTSADTLVIYGGSASSSLTGSSQIDAFLAGSGNDTIDAGAGDDYISAGAGNDVILAGAGSDIVYGGAGNDYIAAGSGNDIVLAGDGDDSIFGGLGNQILFGEAGNNVIFTGDGNTFAAGGTGNDTIYGGAGNEYMLGDAGDDFIVASGSGSNTLVGGAGNDDLRGGAGTDTFFAGDGRDYLTGGGGTDYFYVFDQGPRAGDQKFLMDFDTGGAPDYLVLPSSAKASTIVFDQGGYTWVASGASGGGYDYLAIVGQPGAATVQSRIIWS